MDDNALNFKETITAQATDYLMVARLENGVAIGGGYYSVGDLLDFLNDIQVIDNLTSTNTTSALSANQGKILKDLVDAKANSVQEDIIYPTLLNNATSDYTNQLRYYKDTIGEVHIKGSISNSDGTIPCFQLISGYRSNIAISYFNVTSLANNTINKAEMASSGNVYIAVPDGDTAYINFTFRAEQ